MTNAGEVAAHTPLFLDANIFLYFLLRDERYGDRCEALLSRVETGELIGFTDPLVLSETLYLFIKTHVVAAHRLRPDQFLSFSKSHPQATAGVDLSVVMRLFALEALRVVSPPHHVALELWPLVHRYGLLPNDAYHLITMRFLNLVHLASNDADFARVPDLIIWKP